MTPRLRRCQANSYSSTETSSRIEKIHSSWSCSVGAERRLVVNHRIGHQVRSVGGNLWPLVTSSWLALFALRLSMVQSIEPLNRSNRSRGPRWRACRTVPNFSSWAKYSKLSGIALSSAPPIDCTTDWYCLANTKCGGKSPIRQRFIVDHRAWAAR
jgi:hypothetical protein